MHALKFTLLLSGALIMALSLSACSSHFNKANIEASSHYKDGEFINSEPFKKPGFSETLGIAKRFFFEDKINTEPKQPIAITTITAKDITNACSTCTVIAKAEQIPNT